MKKENHDKSSKTEDAEKRLSGAVLEGKKVNLFDELFNLDGVDELMVDLDEEQKVKVRKSIMPMVDSYQKVIDILTETLQDPNKKNAFIEEAKRRFGGK